MKAKYYAQKNYMSMTFQGNGQTKQEAVENLLKHIEHDFDDLRAQVIKGHYYIDKMPPSLQEQYRKQITS